MKTKLFKQGKQKYKAYLKPVGKGYEVGLLWGTKPLFVGNFINNPEATAWYQLMCQEYERFAKKYSHAPYQPTAFYHKFVTNNLYKHYYDYLDKCFGKYTKNYHREFSRDVKVYNKMKKHWQPKDIPYMRRAS